MRKIVIDLEGSDNGSEVLFDGVLKAAEQFPELQFILAPRRLGQRIGSIV